MSGGLSYPGYLYPARPPPAEYPMQKTYRVGNGCIRILTDICRDPRGYWDRIDISVIDSVVENGCPSGSAKFDLGLAAHDVRGTRWVLTVNHGGSFSSKGRKIVQDRPEERELHFYGGRDKIRGCFFLAKDADSPIWAVARLLFGFDRGDVHAITIKIRRRNGSFFTDIDGPTIVTRNQLQYIANQLSYVSSRDDADTEDDEGKSKKERDMALGKLDLIKSVGSYLNGVANGSIVNIQEFYYGANGEAINKKQ